MPKLLSFAGNPIGNHGLVALAAPLCKMPAFNQLASVRCDIDDEGVASLVANLGKDDFKALKQLWLAGNNINDAGMSSLAAALDAGRLPSLRNGHAYDMLFLEQNPASASAVQAVKDALARRGHADAAASAYFVEDIDD